MCPAALVRGYRSDDPPAPLDTVGMPTLTQGTLPASVAWQPSVALLPTPVQGSAVQRVPFDAENEQREQHEREHIAQMRALHAQGWGQNCIIEHLLG